MIYIRTMISTASEVHFIRLMLSESKGYVDKIIVYEANRTHVGTPRSFLFQEYLKTYSPEEQSRIIYVQDDLSTIVKDGVNNTKASHKNEQLIRSRFQKYVSLRPWDIIIAVDADEIIFRRSYQPILQKLRWYRPAVQLKLHQFFYKMNYLWKHKVFTAPTVCYAWYCMVRPKPQWRYYGFVVDQIVGVHFSWCLTVDEMIQKLHSYAHQREYHHVADRALLEHAIKTRTYPFSSEVDFDIEIVDPAKRKELYPDTFDPDESVFAPYIYQTDTV